MNEKKLKERLRQVDLLLEDTETCYQLGFLKAWLARLATYDITVAQELEARLLKKTSDK